MKTERIMITSKLMVISWLVFCLFWTGYGCSGNNHKPDDSANETSSQNTTSQMPDDIIMINQWVVPAEGYKQYLQYEGDIHFSFSYPDYFKFNNDDTLSGYAMVSFVDTSFGDDENATQLILSTYKKDTIGFNNAEALYKDNVIRLDNLKDINIIQQFKFHNDVISGFLMEYSYLYGLGYVEPLEGIGFEASRDIRVITKAAIFDQNDYIWRITLRTPIESYEVYRGVLETIINSFEVIE